MGQEEVDNVRLVSCMCPLYRSLCGGQEPDAAFMHSELQKLDLESSSIYVGILQKMLSGSKLVFEYEKFNQIQIGHISHVYITRCTKGC